MDAGNLVIYSSDGKILYNKYDGETTIDVKSFTNGIYWLKMKSKVGQVYIKKLVISK